MENLAMNIVNEVVETEGFTVKDDKAAEWALSKIREEAAELARMEILCQNMIDTYKSKIEKANKDYEQHTSWLRSQLQQYFETVPRKATKTQETYTLPSGKLKKKFGGVDYIKDDEKLLQWVKDNGGTENYVQVKETVKWAELKETITVKGAEAIDSDGEVIPGIKIETKPDKFEIEL